MSAASLIPGDSHPVSPADGASSAPLKDAFALLLLAGWAAVSHWPEPSCPADESGLLLPLPLRSISTRYAPFRTRPGMANGVPLSGLPAGSAVPAPFQPRECLDRRFPGSALLRH